MEALPQPWMMPGICGTGMSEFEFYAFRLVLMRRCRVSRSVDYDPELTLLEFVRGGRSIRLPSSNWSGAEESYPQWMVFYVWAHHQQELAVWAQLQAVDVLELVLVDPLAYGSKIAVSVAPPEVNLFRPEGGEVFLVGPAPAQMLDHEVCRPVRGRYVVEGGCVVVAA